MILKYVSKSRYWYQTEGACVSGTMQRPCQKEEQKADADSKQISERMLTVVLLDTGQPQLQGLRALARLK